MAGGEGPCVDHTLHYGMGVFEGIRAYETARGTAIFRLAEHIGRPFRSARILGIPMPYDRATLTEVCRRVVHIAATLEASATKRR